VSEQLTEAPPVAGLWPPLGQIIRGQLKQMIEPVRLLAKLAED
jgi:hypothetical protein